MESKGRVMTVLNIIAKGIPPKPINQSSQILIGWTYMNVFWREHILEDLHETAKMADWSSTTTFFLGRHVCNARPEKDKSEQERSSTDKMHDLEL